MPTTTGVDVVTLTTGTMPCANSGAFSAWLYSLAINCPVPYELLLNCALVPSDIQQSTSKPCLYAGLPSASVSVGLGSGCDGDGHSCQSRVPTAILSHPNFTLAMSIAMPLAMSMASGSPPLLTVQRFCGRLTRIYAPLASDDSPNDIGMFVS